MNNIIVEHKKDYKQLKDYFNNFKTVTYKPNSVPSVPSTNCNTNNILDYSVKEIGGMFKWDKL